MINNRVLCTWHAWWLTVCRKVNLPAGPAAPLRPCTATAMAVPVPLAPVFEGEKWRSLNSTRAYSYPAFVVAPDFKV